MFRLIAAFFLLRMIKTCSVKLLLMTDVPLLENTEYNYAVNVKQQKSCRN